MNDKEPKHIKAELKDIRMEVRKCYGAYSSLQAQLHHINGVIDEIRLLFEEISVCFKDLFEDWKKVLKELKK